MSKVTVTGNVTDITGSPDPDQLTFFVPEIRDGVLSTRRKKVSPNSTTGAFSVQLEAGPAAVIVRGTRYSFTAAAGDLSALIALALAVPPETGVDKLQDAVDQWAATYADSHYASQSVVNSKLSKTEAAATYAATTALVKGTLTGVTGEMRGDSWLAVPYNDALQFPLRLPPASGMTVMNNYAVSGSRIQDAAFDAILDGPRKAVPGAAAMVVVNSFGNALAETDTAARRAATLEAARALVAVLSASTRVEASTAGTFSTSPAWTATNASAPYASAGTTAATAGVDGAYVDIPVPAGTSYLLTAGADPSEFVGGSLTVTQGSMSVTKDLNAIGCNTLAHAFGSSPVAVRLPNLSAGTIRVTTSTAGRSGAVVVVDAVLPQAVKPPTIYLVKAVELRDPAFYPKPDLLAYLRSIPDTIAAEFPNVVVIDPAEGWDPVSMLGPDQIHLNEAGQSHLFSKLVTAVHGVLVRAGSSALTKPTADASYNAKIPQTSTAPASPSVGDLWLDTSA